MRLLCKDCKYYVIEKPDWEQYSEEQKIKKQEYLCSHPETVYPVNGDYRSCCSVRDAGSGECGLEAKFFEKK
jgi:hypothetical protein